MFLLRIPSVKSAPAAQIARDARTAGTCTTTTLPRRRPTRSDHLSCAWRSVSQGARMSFSTLAGVANVANLATRPAADPAFNTHQTLRGNAHRGSWPRDIATDG